MVSFLITSTHKHKVKAVGQVECLERASVWCLLLVRCLWGGCIIEEEGWRGVQEWGGRVAFTTGDTRRGLARLGFLSYAQIWDWGHSGTEWVCWSDHCSALLSFIPSMLTIIIINTKTYLLYLQKFLLVSNVNWTNTKLNISPASMVYRNIFDMFID